MHSVITSKYQTTIPKAVREKMNLTVKDTLEWVVDGGKIVVIPVRKKFLAYQNTIRIGEGDIRADIEMARKMRAEKNQ